MARQVSKKHTKSLTKGMKKTVSAAAKSLGVRRRKGVDPKTKYTNLVTVSLPQELYDACDATEASSILDDAAGHLRARAALRDQPGGERSMARAVSAFNALFRRDLTEREGWMFMVFLKAARATNTPTGILDDYQDGAAYFALAGEAALKQSEG